MKFLTFFIMFFIYAANAYEPGCTSGEIVERTATFNKTVQTFYFSKDCTLRDENEITALMKGAAYVNLEVYWPGLISHKEMTRIVTTKNNTPYIRSFITLSCSPNPLMISSAIDAYYAQKKYKLIKEDNDYSYFVKKEKTLSNSANSLHKTTFIAPKHRKDFWVMCMKKQCHAVGIVNDVKYELHLLTKDYQNWYEIHETMILFIKKIKKNNPIVS